VQAASTKDRILDAAARLFAERGFAGTSLRAVTSAAGVNLGAVNYHFGSKEELLGATLKREIAPLNAERLRRLELIESAPDAPSVETLVDALLRPALETDLTGLRGLALILYSESVELVRPLIRELFGEYTDRFTKAFARALPHLGPDEVALRFQFLIGALNHVLSGRHLLTPRIEALPEPPSSEQVLKELTALLSAGMRAPRVQTLGARSEDAA
jgi:AcrR family transcriptional regulator